MNRSSSSYGSSYAVIRDFFLAGYTAAIAHHNATDFASTALTFDPSHDSRRNNQICWYTAHIITSPYGYYIW
jgi:hypothetical protein